MSKAQSIIHFSKFVVNEQVFYKTKYTYALVNLKPIVPGHVLVCPLRIVPRLKDLTDEESIDYIRTLQKVHKFIEYIYKAGSLNIAIQDGPEAGQSVPHLHAHLIPRTQKNNIGDKIYERLNNEDLEDEFHKRKQYQKDHNDFVVKPDSERIDRTSEEMTNEAIWLSEEIKKYYNEQ